MGVAGLWPLLDSSSKTVSLASLSLGKFIEPQRGYRLGIDASLWFVHAEYGKEGENPELRTLFFRCANLLKYPLLPLFVFDGPKRPDWKRGKMINKKDNKLTPSMKAIIEAFGFEWRTAPGEAEAELAYLNAEGIIDGVLSDDVDTFVFGAHTVVRNPSSTHSNEEKQKKQTHVRIYTNIECSRADLIFIALCAGGDYCEVGLPGCGIKTAYALAGTGLAASLYKAATTLSRSQLSIFLHTWRETLIEELLTDSHRCLGRKMAALAKSVPDSFPAIDVILAYTQPTTSLTEGDTDHYASLSWTRKEAKISALASLCERYFEWGSRASIIKRFRSIIWPGITLRFLRRRVIESGSAGSVLPSSEDHCIPGDDWIMKIHSERTHPSTDQTPEYRVEVDPTRLVREAEAGIQGIRRTKDKEKNVGNEEQDGNGLLRIWLPALLVRQAKPKLVEAFEEVLQAKKAPLGRNDRMEMNSRDEKQNPKGKMREETFSAENQSQDDLLFQLKGQASDSGLFTPPKKKEMHIRKPEPFPMSFNADSEREYNVFFLDTYGDSTSRPPSNDKASPPPLTPSPSKSIISSRRRISISSSEEDMRKSLRRSKADSPRKKTRRSPAKLTPSEIIEILSSDDEPLRTMADDGRSAVKVMSPEVIEILSSEDEQLDLIQ